MKFKKRHVLIILVLGFVLFKGYMFFGSAQIYNDEDWDGSTVYLIPSTHADPYWKGEWAGPNIGILHDNIMDALEMIQMNPDFRYTIDQSSIVSTFLMEHPEYRTDLRMAIENGQIEVAGAGVSQPDLNIPNGEGMIRNVLIGNTWFQEEFGTSINVGWQVDTFGAPGTTPTLFSALDYKYLYFWRNSRNLPAGAFWWEGPEGSRILCWRTKYGRYPLTSVDLVGMVRNLIDDPMASTLPSGDMMLHIGGDKAAPLTHLMDYIESWNVFYAENSGYRCKVATPSEFFEKIKDESSGLDTYGFGEDINPYDEGAYAAYIETKVYSRLWETQAATAEIFSTLGRNVANISDVEEPTELDSGWNQNAFFYHHDTVTGTSPYPVAQDFLNDYRAQANRADGVLNQALTSFGQQVATTSYNNSLIVYNSESNDRSEIIETNIPLDLTEIPEYDQPLFDINKIGIEINNTKFNSPVPCEIISIETPVGSSTVADVAFLAEVNSVGYNTFSYNFTYDETPLFPVEINHTTSVNSVNIDNGFYNITWDMTQGGDIVSLLRQDSEQLSNGHTIGLAYADTSNDIYNLPINSILGRTKEFSATYSLTEGRIVSELIIDVSTDYYDLIITYIIKLNSSIVDVSVNYEYLDDQYVVGNALMMNWPWLDSSGEWFNGAPYGWTEHTADKSDTKPYPATYWSIIENETQGIAVYDRGTIARDWNTNEECKSMILIHQNDPPRGSPGENDPLNEYEKEDFGYNEVNNFTLELAFEYYEPIWYNASIGQKGRNFNHPMQVVVVTDSDSPEMTNRIDNNEVSNLPNWASFVRINASNIAMGALKPSDVENGVIIRTISYPSDTISNFDINISFCENIDSDETPNKMKLVSALEKPFGINASDPSIENLSLEYNITSGSFSFNFSSDLFSEGKIRTFLLDYEKIDCLAPKVALDVYSLGYMYSPTEIKVLITDNSSVQVTGYYTDDEGETWTPFSSFDILSVGENQWQASITIIPTVRGKLRMRIFVEDAQGNLETIGQLNTTYSHLHTSYADRDQVAYHYPQIRNIWPIFISFPLVFGLIFVYWLILKPKRDLRERNAQGDGENEAESQKEGGKEREEESGKQKEVGLKSDSQEINHFKKGDGNTELGFTRKLINWRNTVAKEIPMDKYIILTVLFGIFLFTFIQQMMFVFDYSDITDVIWFDEYILDLMQFVRRNNRFFSIYLTFTFIILLLLTILIKYKYDYEMSALVGLVALGLPFVALMIHMFMILLSGGISLLPSLFIFHEVLHFYDNPMVLMFHIFSTICPILIPRLFNIRSVNDDESVENEDRAAVDSKTLSMEKPLERSMSKKILKAIWWIGSWSVQLAILCYFTTIVFVDYFTHYKGGTAFGGLSSGQAYVIWCYYAFVVIFFAAYSVVFGLISEVLPEKVKQPWSLKHRVVLVLSSQAISIFAAYIYYGTTVQYLPGIITVEPEIFWLLFPTIFMSLDTMMFILITTTLPHVIIHLIFYPFKSLFHWSKERKSRKQR